MNILVANPAWLGCQVTVLYQVLPSLLHATIPAGILIGASTGWLKGWKIPILNNSNNKVNNALILLTVILLIGTGVFKRVNACKMYSHRSLPWPLVRMFGPQFEFRRTRPWGFPRFLVNSFPAYKNSVIVGSDGGWWLPLLARRNTTLPPITYTFEKDPRPGYRGRSMPLPSIFRRKEFGTRMYCQILKTAEFRISILASDRVR